jgi:TolB-like protein/Tfp pilus assembly protein PilF
VANVERLPYEGAGLLVERTRTQIVQEESEESAAETIERTKASAPLLSGTNPARPSRAVSIALACAVVAFTAITVALYRHRSNSGESQPTPIRSIAVLPLKNLSDDPSNEYFSDGMTESVIMALSQVNDLKVISRGSVIRFKGKETDPREVGRQLGVAAVLEGSVRKGADSVRVAVRLVSVDDRRVLWARDTNERALGDIFALQDEIARSLVEGLRVRLTGEAERKLARRYTEDVDAYQLYLRGRYFWNKRTEAGLKKSIEYFEQAIAKDRQFALAHAGLADSYAIFNLYGAAQLPDALPRARAAAERALVLDDTLAEAHTVLALVKEQYEWDWTGAEHEFQRAIELNPNYATAHQYYSEYLAFRGRTEESLVHIKQAHNLDPLSLIINTTLGYPYLCARQCDLAIEAFRKAREMDPNFPLAIFYTARCYELNGNYEQAIAEYRQAVALSGGSSLTLAGLGHAYAKSRRPDQARGVLHELTEMSKQRYVSPYLIGTVYVGLGDNDQALQWLEKARREHDYSLVLLGVDARLDSLRQNPRFAELQQRIGLVP